MERRVRVYDILRAFFRRTDVRVSVSVYVYVCVCVVCVHLYVVRCMSRKPVGLL